MTDTNNGIMGFIPKDQYLKITYMLLLVASGGGLLIAVLAMLGVIVPLGGLFGLAGIAGLVLALLGYFVYKDEFSSLVQSHLLYLSVLIGIFIVVGLVIGASLFNVNMMYHIISVLISIVQFLLVFTGFNSHNHGREVNKNNIKGEVQSALKRV